LNSLPKFKITHYLGTRIYCNHTMPNPSIFISYRVADTQTEARLIYLHLASQFGEEAVFLDKKRINPGNDWPDELEQSLQSSRVIVVLVKNVGKWIGEDKNRRWRIRNPDDWVRKEIEHGLSEKKTIIPILIDGGEFPHWDDLPTLKPLERLQAFKLLTDENIDPLLRELVEKIKEYKIPLNPAKAPGRLLDEYPLPDNVTDPLDHYDAPYLGLRYFDAHAARLFHGRSHDLLEFFKFVQNREVRLISLYGESGVGKSSFLAAGALPRMASFSEPVYVRRDRTHRDGLAGQLADAQQKRTKHHLPAVYILDQAEEMFTDPLRDEQDNLVAGIKDLLKKDQTATVVLGFRSDYLLNLSDLLRRVDERREEMALRALTLTELTEAIEGVYHDLRLSKRYLLKLEDNFARRVATDLMQNESGWITAILQNRLLKLYKEAMSKRSAAHPDALLTYSDYSALAQHSSAEKELLDYQVERLRTEKGLNADDRTVYGALNEFVVDKATARSVARGKVETPGDLLDKLLQVNLLTELADSRAVRLSHDLLAKEVRERYQQALRDENEQGKIKLVQVRMRDTRKMLEEINFEGAFHEYRETTNLDVLPDELWPVGYELAYIYLNAGKLTEGAFLLSETRRHLDIAGKLPLRLQGQPLPDKTDTHAQLEHLRQCEPDYFLQMEYRYFPKMVFIKGGTFYMGDVMDDKISDSELPVHSVTLGDYELSETPQTWWQYGLYCFAIGIDMPGDSGLGKGNRPVTQVSWENAVKYAEWLSAHRNEKFRLPTEAEWEFAARERGRKVRFGNGKDEADAREMNFDAEANSDFSVIGEYRKKTTDVKEFPPNALGLYDMSGNVREWCEDWLKPYPGGNGEDYTGSSRVIRGGSFYNGPQFSRVASRQHNAPYSHHGFVGFRLARTN